MNDHFNNIYKAGLDIGAVGWIMSNWFFQNQNSIATVLSIVWLTYCIVEAGFSLFKRYRKRHHVD